MKKNSKMKYTQVLSDWKQTLETPRLTLSTKHIVGLTVVGAIGITLLCNTSNEFVATKETLLASEKELQQSQLKNQLLQEENRTVIDPSIDNEQLELLEEKAFLLEEKILELEQIKTTLSEQLQEVSAIAPMSLVTAVETSLTVEEMEIEPETTRFVPVIKTSYQQNVFVSDQLNRIDTLYDQTNLEFTAIATEAIETLSAYSDIPSGSPVIGGIFSSPYTPTGLGGRIHKGVDFSTNSQILPVVATAAGTVVFSGADAGFGNHIILDHGNGFRTLYAHQTKNMVSVGDLVTKGQQIGTTGSTGFATGVHCHYEITLNGAYQNPVDYL
ncbi:MAG: M23 family metallopeptidase [Bacillota bacterium]